MGDVKLQNYFFLFYGSLFLNIGKISVKNSWVVAIRGVRGGRRDFLFFSWAVFLAVAAVTSMIATAQTLYNLVDQEARRSLAADLRLESAAPFNVWMDTHLRKPGRVVAENLEFTAMVRVPGSTQTVLVEVLAVSEEHPVQGVVELASGGSLSAALSKEGAVVEPALQTRLAVSIGQTFYLGEARFQLTDLLLREPDRVTRFFRWGPRLVMPKSRIAQTGLVAVGSRIKYVALVRLQTGEDLEQVARQLRESKGGPAIQVITPAESQPSARRFIHRFTTFLVLITLLTLLTTGNAMAGSMAAHVREHRAQIAIFKSLGASHRQVMGIFFWRVLLMSAPGSLVGAVVGMASPFLLISWGGRGGWEDFLAILPAWTLFFWGAGAGIVVGLIFSLGPLWGTRGIGPASLFRAVQWDGGMELLHWKWRWGIPVVGTVGFGMVLGHYADLRVGILFVGELVVILAIVWLVAKGGMMVLQRMQPKGLMWRLAVRDLVASGSMGAMVAAGMGLGVVCAIGFLEQNLDMQMVSRIPQRAPSFFFLDVQADQAQELRALVTPYLNVPDDLRMTPVVRGRIKQLKGVQVPHEWGAKDTKAWRFSRDYVLTWSQDLPPGNRVTVGQWWTDPQAREVSVEQEMAKELGLKIGDSLTFDILGVEVSAQVTSLREVHWSDLGLNFFVVFSPAVLQEVPFTYLGSVMVEPRHEEEVRNAVVQRLHNISAIAVREVMEAAQALLNRLVGSVRWAAGLAAVAGLIALGVTVTLTRRRRAKEAAIRRLLGACQRDLLYTAVGEYLLLGLIASLAGVVVGQSVAAGATFWLFNDVWDWQPIVTFFALVAGVGVVVLTGFVATRQDLNRGIMASLRGHD